MADRPPRLAVLIDADNTSPKVADGLFEEVAKIGEASLRRIYGDFSKGQQAGWEKVLQKHAILAQQQFAYTTGKNSTDIALVIDAMDLMHSGRFDGFCLVSSDSDFTRLAARIREQGIDVYGIGQQKTPEAFRQACTRFIFTENFVREAGRRPPASRAALRPMAEAVELIEKALEQMEEDAEGWFQLGAVGQRMQNLSPEFDTRTFGHGKLSDLVEATDRFEINRDGPHVRLRPKPGAEAPVIVAARWAGLAAVSVVLVLLLELARLPAALLLGPMVAGVGFSLAGAGLAVPPLPFRLAQALVGLMIARILTPAGAARRSSRTGRSSRSASSR